MKLNSKLSTILGFALIGLLLVSVPSAVAQDEHDDGGHDQIEDQCDTPDQEVTVIADPNNDGSNEYDVTTINAEPGECVMVTFENNADDEEHSFAIDHEEGIMEHTVHLHLMNSSVEHKMINLQMPDVEATIPFYCNVSDHADDGMVGQILVESSSSLPGFSIVTALSTLTAMMIAIPILRRR